MPIHGNKKRIPLDLEPNLYKDIETKAKESNIARTKLLRIMIKYSMQNIEKAISNGDIRWEPEPQ